ncbi:Arm DNA-binding domain-containing protein [Aquabacterium sp. A3]|uniref:Arm DNA-binding domain-containing protein n=1 Tax=Aquabacterium sp. A3 TaxID=3132829 RepID=UPI003119C210
MPLTDATCKNARCPEGKARERYADSGGLYLEALSAGGKHWRWKYRIGGKEKRQAIGTYPAVTLAQARAKPATMPARSCLMVWTLFSPSSMPGWPCVCARVQPLKP